MGLPSLALLHPGLLQGRMGGGVSCFALTARIEAAVMSSGFLFCFLDGCLKAFTPWRRLIILTLFTIICLPNCRVSDRMMDRRVQEAKYRIYPWQHNIDSHLFPLDTHLQAHQITESSSVFCFKMFYPPRKHDLLVDSQMIVCLLCTWLCAGGTAASFWGNKRILRSWSYFQWFVSVDSRGHWRVKWMITR